MRVLSRAAAAVAVAVGLLTATVPAQAAGPTNVVICNAAVSDAGVKITVYNDYYRSGYAMFRGACWTFGRNLLVVDTINAVSWKVRTNPGAYGSCQQKDESEPGSHDRYEYWVHNHSGC